MKTNSKKRVNITLPEQTIKKINQVNKKGNRSRFINQAVEFYIDTFSRKNLKNQLEEGAKKRAERDRKIAAEWFYIDEETWEKNQNQQ